MSVYDDLLKDDEDESIGGSGLPEPVDTIAGPGTQNQAVYDRIQQVRQGTAGEVGASPSETATTPMSKSDLAAMEYAHGAQQDAGIGRALNAVASGFGAKVDNSGYNEMVKNASDTSNKMMDRSARVTAAVEARKGKEAALARQLANDAEGKDRWQKTYDQRDRAISAAGERIKTAHDQKEADKITQLTTPLGVANTEDDAKQLKTAYESKKNFDNKIQEMIALREKHGGGALLDREDIARGKQLSKDLLLEYKNMAKLGVLSQSDEKIINAIIPEDPLQYNSPAESLMGQDPTLHRLKAFKGDSDKDFATRVATRIRKGTETAPPPAPPEKSGTTEVADEVERNTADGKVAVFDAKTKKFLRYKNG